jgi:hypothetical protein
MLTLGPGYARLDIHAADDFVHVSESVRAMLHVCHLNGLPGGLIVSRQDAFDWRSSLRVGLRFAASRAGLQGLRLALLAEHFNDGASEDVVAVARQVGLDCRMFRSEAEALAWLASGGARSGPAVPTIRPRR